MRSVLGFMAALLAVSVCQADRPIFLVTPAGVYQSIVDSTGKPGPWVQLSADLIVQGFPDNTPDPPPVPPTDSTVLQLATMSKVTLKDKNDAVAVSAIIDSIAKLNLSETDFRQSMEMAVPIMDASLSAGGRLNEWSKKALLITADPAKLKAGLASAFGVEQSTLDDINAAAINPTAEATARAVNWALIISIIKTIIELLTNLGIGGGN